MADAEFNFQQCSFLLELHILQIFFASYKYPFIPWLIKISWFIRVFYSKMDYIKIIQNGGSKMADAFSVFLRKWRHNDITALVKYYLYLRQLLDFIKHITIWVFFALCVRYLANKFSNMTP